MTALVCFSHGAHATTWNSDWGPVRVKADGENFVARYKNRVSGIIVMRNQGGGNYSDIGLDNVPIKNGSRFQPRYIALRGAALKKGRPPQGA